MACRRVRASGCSRVGYGISLLGGGHHKPTIERPELTQDWEIDTWRAQIEACVHQNPEKGVMTPQETDPDLPMSVQESLVEA